MRSSHALLPELKLALLAGGLQERERREAAASARRALLVAYAALGVAAATLVVWPRRVSAVPAYEFEVVRILRKTAVAKRVGLGKSTIDQMVRRGKSLAQFD